MNVQRLRVHRILAYAKSKGVVANEANGAPAGTVTLHLPYTDRGGNEHTYMVHVSTLARAKVEIEGDE